MIAERSRRAEIFICSIVLAMLCLGAGPKQSEVPPQAFFADYFSGTVAVQGYPPQSGIGLLACVRECGIFESERVNLAADGKFGLLEVNPADRFLRGDQIRFYLVNAHGRIEAVETAIFEGKYGIIEIQLNFNSDLPTPMAPPQLPEVGDPVLRLLPGLVIGIGRLALGWCYKGPDPPGRMTGSAGTAMDVVSRP